MRSAWGGRAERGVGCDPTPCFSGWRTHPSARPLVRKSPTTSFYSSPESFFKARINFWLREKQSTPKVMMFPHILGRSSPQPHKDARICTFEEGRQHLGAQLLLGSCDGTGTSGWGITKPPWEPPHKPATAPGVQPTRLE